MRVQNSRRFFCNHFIHHCLVSHTFPVFSVSQDNNVVKKLSSLFRAASSYCPPNIQATFKLAARFSIMRGTGERHWSQRALASRRSCEVSGMCRRKKGSLILSPFSPFCCLTPLVFSCAGASAPSVSAAVLERRKRRKGFACSSAYTGSRVEEMRPALQAR